MITDRIMAYLGGEGVAVDEQQLNVAAAICRASLKRNLGEDRETGARKVRLPRPSGSFACPRQIIYNACGLQTEGYDWRARLTFTHGDMTEAMGVLLARQAMGDTIVTPDKDGTQLALSASLNPADFGLEGEPIHMQGHVDMTITGHGGHEEAVDWKSCSRYAYQNMGAAATDPDHKWWTKERLGYIAQVRLYMMLARAMGRGPMDRGYLVFVCKDTGHVAEVLITKDDEAERDIVKILLWARTKIDEAHTVRADALGAAGFDELDEDAGNEDTDRVLEAWIQKNVKRPQWAMDSLKQCGPRTKRPDGTNGTCLEVNTKATPNSWRCNYCPHASRCWPDFAVVPLAAGPVMRTNR